MSRRHVQVHRQWSEPVCVAMEERSHLTGWTHPRVATHSADTCGTSMLPAAISPLPVKSSELFHRDDSEPLGKTKNHELKFTFL